MRRIMLVLGLLALPPGASAGPAHPPALVDAAPSADSVAQGAPDVVELTFDAGIDAKLSTIMVRRDGASRVDTGNAHVVGDDHHLAVGLKTLLPGHYVVKWTAAAPGRGQASGSYGFTVGQ